MNTYTRPWPRNGPEARVAQVMGELVACSSLELSPDRTDDAREIAAMLPAGTRVYVNHPPRYSIVQSLAALKALHAAGLEPVAHIAARRLASREELESFVERAARECGLSKVLVLGGDEPRSLGPYQSGVEVLREGILAQHGIREVGLAGYPEGHPRIPTTVLKQALLEKLEIASAQGLGAFLVTQFSFAPTRVVEYCAELARTLPALPIYAGFAGPTDARTLLRFAKLCGVSASLRALRDQGMGAIQLFTHTDPLEQLVAVARYCAGRSSCNVVGAHFFSFGGARRTATWVNQEITAVRDANVLLPGGGEQREY